jgi:hypothetical protein
LDISLISYYVKYKNVLLNGFSHASNCKFLFVEASSLLTMLKTSFSVSSISFTDGTYGVSLYRDSSSERTHPLPMAGVSNITSQQAGSTMGI